MAMILWLCLASNAGAHASLTGTFPEDGSVIEKGPDRLSLSFSEPVSPLSLRLIQPDGSQVSLGNFVLRDARLDIGAPSAWAQGTYILSWRVVSEDGHPVGGAVVFSIGAPSAAPPAAADEIDWTVRSALWLAKICLYAGLFFGIGGSFAFYWFLGGAQVGRSFVTGMLATGVVASIGSAGLQGLDALGASLDRFLDPEIWVAGLTTSYGQTVVAMLVASGLAFIALSIRRAARWVALLALVSGSAALALSGHASVAAPQWLTRPSVFLHAFCIAIWVGALVPLGVMLWRRDSGGPDALRRFSRFIPVAVLIVAAAGIALAVVQVERPAALLSTAYGKVLVIKLALLCLLLALAALNRWSLTKPAFAGGDHAVRLLTRSILAETLIVLTVFGVAALWRFTPPPRTLAIAAVQPLSTHLHSQKAMVEITITPGRAGPVDIAAVVMTGDFGPLDAKEVTFVLSNPGAGIEPVRRSAHRGADGVWRSANVLLPLPGAWKIRVDVLISDFDLVRIEGGMNLRAGD
jgi:copper transport protein